MPDLARETGDGRWPRVVPIDGGEKGEVRRGAAVFRVVRRALWDTSSRISLMDRQGVGVQVVSPMPIALTYWADPDLALRFAREFNDGIAKAVEESEGRLWGLGTVPLHDPGAAVDEMERVIDTLHLHGIEIGTAVGRAELSDPGLRPFFRAAADRQVPLFVHPVDGSGATRCSSPSIDFSIGMHTDTSLAGYALVYGGVMEDFPDLRICLSHGGGSFPWTHPRMRVVDKRENELLDALVRRLWADTLVFEAEMLPVLLRRYGAEHLVLGSDYPFLAAPHLDPQRMLEEAVVSGIVSEFERSAILSDNALSFLDRA
jgi:aminocarboxymuconate-semialdehyde decarboxylase